MFDDPWSAASISVTISGQDEVANVVRHRISRNSGCPLVTESLRAGCLAQRHDRQHMEANDHDAVLDELSRLLNVTLQGQVYSVSAGALVQSPESQLRPVQAGAASASTEGKEQLTWPHLQAAEPAQLHPAKVAGTTATPGVSTTSMNGFLSTADQAAAPDPHQKVNGHDAVRCALMSTS